MAPKTLGPGIQKDRRGFRVFVKVATGVPGRMRLRTKRFPKTATLTEMRQWREDRRTEARALRQVPQRGTLAEDIDRYLELVAAMPTIEWRRRDLYAWREVFGDLPRSKVTTDMVRAQLQRWRTRGPVAQYVPRQKTFRLLTKPLSASACNHRRTALLHLWTVLDGRGAVNPVREVPAFQEPPAAPRAHDLDFLEAAIARIQNPKDQARARVLLWTGIRGTSELGKMKPEHVQLDDTGGECHVPTGKGGRRYRFVPLNDRGVAAWRSFIDANAWGSYDKNLLRKSFQRACRAESRARKLPLEAVRVYDLRHSVATAYLRAGADLADVQDMLGHTTPRMTRRYAPLQREKLHAAARALSRKSAS
jgi:integrase